MSSGSGHAMRCDKWPDTSPDDPDTETGVALRTGIQSNFGYNLFATVSPFAIISILTVAVTGCPRIFRGENYALQTY